MTERPDQRSAHAKVFERGPGQFRVQVSPELYHVPDDPSAWARGEPITWEDQDHGFDAVEGAFRLRKSWCRLDIPTDTIGYRYQSRLTGGTLDVQLIRLDTTFVATLTLPAPRLDGRDIWWDDVVPDLDLYAKIRPGRVEVFKRLKGPLAPKRFLWRLTESLPSVVPLTLETSGVDNADRAEPSRIGTGPGRCRRRIQMDHVQGPDDLTTRPGFRIFTLNERWTGQTIALDANRVPSLSDEVVYPVLIDQDVTETITADADDGHQDENGGAWVVSQGSAYHSIYAGGAGSQQFPGYRFQTVAVPQAATIDAATLTLVGLSGGGGVGAGASLFGNDIDDAPAWANGAGPLNMTPTTASTSFVPWGNSSTGTQNYNVATIVQEIVNRAGWVSGNDLSLGVQGTLSPGGCYSQIDDLAGGASGIAVLTIDFTPFAPPTAVLTGTATASIVESDIVTGSKTIILTLTDDTFISN